jgi:hypothetical protein
MVMSAVAAASCLIGIGSEQVTEHLGETVTVCCGRRFTVGPSNTGSCTHSPCPPAAAGHACRCISHAVLHLQVHCQGSWRSCSHASPQHRPSASSSSADHSTADAGITRDIALGQYSTKCDAVAGTLSWYCPPGAPLPGVGDRNTLLAAHCCCVSKSFITPGVALPTKRDHPFAEQTVQAAGHHQRITTSPYILNILCTDKASVVQARPSSG